MRLGGEAAAEDADAAAYETLDVSAREPATEGEIGLLGEIRRWHVAGRPDAAQSERQFHRALVLEYEIGEVFNVTEYVDERLAALEDADNDNSC